ncbi:Trafficking protein particle complex subunit 1 [Gracilariopsis chorda]|uniref:Trafficking protein particle complex subunit n=1 Tax=Gracilariopsis chorda TaxID=448386 RepID=A0A2V3IID0_9FLOR|nr:Trafficking protein particle complex subunit 1 [Gracilariopsis chorda]|eukprot:PXF40900.1 Trafficking protein particle complex subunit 1 [Gracilariopsis chorda]
MAVYCFYLFDRTGTCLCYYEWNRSRSLQDASDDQKNMFGMLFALRNFSVKLSPDPAKGVPTFFVTDVYALHYFETPTGLRFVLITSHDCGSVDVTRHLTDIYAEVYVEYAIKNPLYVKGSKIDYELFLSKLDSYVRSLPCF